MEKGSKLWLELFENRNKQDDRVASEVLGVYKNSRNLKFEMLLRAETTVVGWIEKKMILYSG